MRRLGDRSGFTLLELVITLTILGFLVLMVSGVLHLGATSWERGEQKVELYQKKRIVLDLVGQQIKSAYPYRVKAQKAEADYIAFRGDKESIRFVSAFSIKSKRQEGLVFAILRAFDGPLQTKVLKIYEKRVLNKDFMDETPDYDQFMTLVDSLGDASFEYYDEGEGKEEGGEWVESWDAKERKKLPHEIKMTMKWKESEKSGDTIMPVVFSVPATMPDDRGVRVRFPRPTPVSPR